MGSFLDGFFGKNFWKIFFEYFWTDVLEYVFGRMFDGFRRFFLIIRRHLSLMIWGVKNKVDIF